MTWESIYHIRFCTLFHQCHVQITNISSIISLCNIIVNSIVLLFTIELIGLIEFISVFGFFIFGSCRFVSIPFLLVSVSPFYSPSGSDWQHLPVFSDQFLAIPLVGASFISVGAQFQSFLVSLAMLLSSRLDFPPSVITSCVDDLVLGSLPSLLPPSLGLLGSFDIN